MTYGIYQDPDPLVRWYYNTNLPILTEPAETIDIGGPRYATDDEWMESIEVRDDTPDNSP